MPPDPIVSIVDRCLAPGCFYVVPGARLRIEGHVAQELPWEIYFGHLLDAKVARRRERFTSWKISLDEPASSNHGPLVSVHWQPPNRQLHVTRQILTHGFEAYEDEPGVILTRPTQKCVTELVGSVRLADARSERLGHELGELLFLAVIGTSRLPITSLESPLPAYSLGRLAYIPDLSLADAPWSDVSSFLGATLTGEHSLIQQAKALETALRSGSGADIGELTAVLRHSIGDATAATRLLRTVFNTAALSPYTHFADSLIGLIIELAETEWYGSVEALELLSYMLRHLCRHLTAFDLVVFHSFGANYPDALFLDALLKAFLKLLPRHGATALGTTGRILRRGLRQACLARKHYEGHRVPDAPTSMGENVRVLPEPFRRVPDEQILESGKRRRRLFDGEPTDSLLSDVTRAIFTASLVDLDDLRELRELGMAHYLDRPLGVLKAAGEIDRTPLLAYVACSRFVAARRLASLQSAGWIDAARYEALRTALPGISVVGVPASELRATERPGVVSLADANKAASDFVFLRTTRSSLDELLGRYDWRPLEESYPDVVHWLHADRDVLVVQHCPLESPDGPVLQAFAGEELRLELGFPRERSTMGIYRQQAGGEVVCKLHVLRAWDVARCELVHMRERGLWLEARVEAGTT